MKKDKYYFPNNVINQMNIPFTVKLATKDPDAVVWQQLQAATKRIDQLLQQVDKDFSPFKPDSLVSKFQRGDQRPLLESADFQSVYAQSILAEEMTDKIFTPYFNGQYDPTGLVKGWAIERAFDEVMKPLLKDSKIDGISLNGGGDIKFATKMGTDFQWGIGIENPDNLQEIIATYYLHNGAIATSGTSKRGEHITRAEESEIEQVSIISGSLVDADIWATVGIAAGIKKFTSMIKENNLSGLLIDKNYEPLNFSKGVITNAKKTSL